MPSSAFRSAASPLWFGTGSPALGWLIGCAAAWALLVLAWTAASPFTVARQIEGAADAPPPLQLQRRAQEGLPLVGHVGFLPDPDASLVVTDLLAPQNQERLRYPAHVFRGRPGQGVIWMQFSVQVPAAQAPPAGVITPSGWLLAVPSVAARDLRLYGPFDASGHALAPPVVTGGDRPFAARPFGSERMVLPLQTPGPGVYRFVLRADAVTSQVYALRIWNTVDYLVARSGKGLFDGICYGVVLAMLVYNLLLLLTFRERVYASYVLNCAAALLTIAGYNGHVARYLLPDAPALAQWLYPVAPVLWLTFALQFGRHFLALRRHAPRIAIAVAAFEALALASVALSPHLPTEWLAHVLELGLFAGSALLIAGAVAAIRAGFGPAWIYLCGIALLVTAAVGLMFADWGLWNWSYARLNMLQLGVCAELVVFSLALGSRIHLIRLTARNLQARTATLKRQAQTDYLTGVANRAGLAARAQEVFESGQPMSLLLLDLDDFKPINDEYGHAAGDRVLEAVASRLRRGLREGDLVARLGGDEFVVLLPGRNDREALAALAQRYVERLHAPVQYGGLSLSVSCSIGLARFPENASDLDSLLHAADQAMYFCKHGHRAGFAFPEDVVRHPGGDASGTGFADAGFSRSLRRTARSKPAS